MAESMCNESRSRRSVVRNRRSTRGHLCLDKEEEICEFIATSMTGEERLEILVQMCIKHALESTFDDAKCSSNVPDKSLVQKSVMSVIEDLRSEIVFGKAVAPLKCASSEPKLDDELEKLIKMAENYVSRLKNESREWECQLGRYENEAVSMQRELEKFESTDKKAKSNEKYRSCIDNVVNYEERLKEMEALYGTIQTQSKEINDSAAIVNRFQRKVDEHVHNESRKFVSFFNQLPSETLHELLMKCQPCEDIPHV